ncbi:MAG TPA: FtsX-like permease family protein [Streptosporangiaceae bacterium]
MIGFGLRLTLRGGREAAVRLTVTAIAVALGTWLLLTAIAGINAVNAQNLREAWLNTVPGSVAGHQVPAAVRAQPTWWELRPDFYHGQLMGRLDVAATGPRSPVPPGIPHLPGPGQYYASSAMIKLLDTLPASELADRYPGHLIGTIADSALPAPDSLLIIIGHSVSFMRQSAAFKIAAIQTIPLNSCNGSQCAIAAGIGAHGMDLILSTVGVGLLLPVLIFIGASTRLSAARREQRFAAMRLTGATPRQITAIASVESAVAAAIGVGIGFALFFALRPAIASFPFSGAPFFTNDMSLSLLDIAAVVVGVPAAAAVVARIALQRVQISPLGVSRRVTPQPPRAWRVIPLLVGMAELAVFIVVGKQKTSADEVLAIMPGFLLVVAGLVIAGPWLTMVGARLLAGRARRPGSLIAARRLADNPQLGFRTISGLTLALFVVTVVISVLTSIKAHQAPPGGVIGNDIVTDQVAGDHGTGSASTVPAPVLARLAGLPGVRATMLVHTNPLGTKLSFPSWGTEPASLVPCGQLARLPVLGKCAPGAAVASFPPEVYSLVLERNGRQSAKLWPTALMTAHRLSTIPVQTIVVATNGSPATIERVRTYLIDSFPNGGVPVTQTEQFVDSNVTKWQRFAYVLIFGSLAIGGCTLAVTVIGGLSERKRPFSLLRLTGVQLRMLQQVVLLETSVPLVFSALVATGAGLLSAYLFLNSQLSYALQWPGAAFYVIVAAGLAASLMLIVGTLPLLRRMTGPEVARNE